MRRTGSLRSQNIAAGEADSGIAAGTRFPIATGGPMLRFDFLLEAEQLRREAAWSNGRNAKTLLKHADFRLVLTVMKRGTRMHQHQAKGTVCIQPVSGHVRIHACGQMFDLGAAQMLSLDPNLPHDVEAVEDSAFLVSIAWPAALRSVEPRNDQRATEESDWMQDESVWN